MKYWLKSAIVMAYSVLYITVNQVPTGKVTVDPVKTADIYRQLADLLLQKGRLEEARQIMELLKLREIKDFTTQKNVAQEKHQVALNRYKTKISAPIKSIISLTKEINKCEETNCPDKSKLNDTLTSLLAEFHEDLQKIEPAINERIATDRSTFRPDSPKAGEIVKAQPDTVMIYPLVLEDKLWLLLYSGDAAKKYEIKVGRNELGNTVKEFRQLMEECEKRVCGSLDIAKIQPVSQILYNWLIKPLEREIKNNKIRNIVFALDRVTRYVPMSALFDGKQYLIENYTIYNVLSAELTDTNKNPLEPQNTPVLAMGVSEAIAGFSPLKNVTLEIDAIVKNNSSNTGIYPGQRFLNGTFDFRSLRDNLTNNKILHIATHGEFIADSKDASYLLLGTGEKLTISNIQNLTGLSKIQLVVLSACQTALAGHRQDGIEIASVAYYFLNRGARAVIASLWLVDDKSTAQLMQNFYSYLTKSKTSTRADALRQAQLSILRTKNSATGNREQRGIRVDVIETTLSRNGQQSATYSHPYYWAPFILIGNGL